MLLNVHAFNEKGLRNAYFNFKDNEIEETRRKELSKGIQDKNTEIHRLVERLRVNFNFDENAIHLFDISAARSKLERNSQTAR